LEIKGGIEMNRMINKSKVLLLAAGGLLFCTLFSAPVANANNSDVANVREYMYNVGYWYRRNIDRIPAMFAENYTREDCERYDRSPLTITHTSVEQMGDITYTEGKILDAGSSTMTNPLKDQDLTLQTIASDFSYTDTATSTVTHGTKFNTEVSAKFNVDIAEMSTKFSLEYNYANTKSETQTKTVTYKIPSQAIKVPAGKTYKISTLLKTGKAIGKVYLNTEFKGPDYKIQKFLSPNSIWHTHFTMGEARHMQRVSEAKRNLFKPETSGTIRHLGGNDFKAVGYGEFQVEYSTDFYIRVDDVTPNNSRSLKNEPVAMYKIPASEIEVSVQ
jgi:hypothetical protein